MEFHIRVKVKFRAFFKTFAEWDRTYRVNYDGGKFDAVQVDLPPPSGAKVLLDRNGVKVNLW